MKAKQIKWARSHDWFVRSIGGDVVVREISTRDGRTRTRLCHFNSFPALYRWAGY